MAATPNLSAGLVTSSLLVNVGVEAMLSSRPLAVAALTTACSWSTEHCEVLGGDGGVSGWASVPDGDRAATWRSVRGLGDRVASSGIGDMELWRHSSSSSSSRNDC